jgi:hypothetical protein
VRGYLGTHKSTDPNWWISVIFRSAPVEEQVRRLYGMLQPIAALEGWVAK